MNAEKNNTNTSRNSKSKQFRFWILTIPHHHFMPFLPPTVLHIAGQLESGVSTSYLHWQLVVTFEAKRTMRQVKELFGDMVHCEPTRSMAARKYCFKKDTQVTGTQFELGE